MHELRKQLLQVESRCASLCSAEPASKNRESKERPPSRSEVAAGGCELLALRHKKFARSGFLLPFFRVKTSRIQGSRLSSDLKAAKPEMGNLADAQAVRNYWRVLVSLVIQKPQYSDNTCRL